MSFNRVDINLDWVVKLRKEGKSWDEIRTITGYADNTVRKKLREANIKIPDSKHDPTKNKQKLEKKRDAMTLNEYMGIVTEFACRCTDVYAKAKDEYAVKVMRDFIRELNSLNHDLFD